jgi:hypothetical protein
MINYVDPLFSRITAVADPEISKGRARSRKGDPPTEIAKNSHILGLKS